MATTFKTLTNNDVTSTRTLLHEAIPITGTIVSGTYTADANIKAYSHGMFKSVYDYPHLSSSANHIFDITAGYSNNSALSSSSNSQNAKKINIYNQMSQVLVGYDSSGNIRDFDEDGNLSDGKKQKEVIFLNFARLLTKDEIKKGSFQLKLYTAGNQHNPTTAVTLQDHGATTSYKVNSPAGEYGILYSSSAHADTGINGLGLIYYQAGVVVLTGSIFGFVDGFTPRSVGVGTGEDFQTVLTGSTIDIVADGFRNRIDNIQFNNTTELNSTIYFCRANHNDFNYSSNPTYLNSSKIQVKNSSTDSPVSYITTVGLYSADNELLAVAKLSEPIKKTPETELTLRVRLDY
tara:strand:+ start:1123 stop:2166 length:1044 start_codon:yes stop_codon:yes gene_type:complete